MGSTYSRVDNGGSDNLDANKNENQSMDKGLKIWHAVVSFLLFLVAVVSMIINQSNKIETQALRINFLESSQRDNALVLREINSKLTDILVKIENKKDKEK